MECVTEVKTAMHLQNQTSKETFKTAGKDVLPNINRVQAAERADKCHFCP